MSSSRMTRFSLRVGRERGCGCPTQAVLAAPSIGLHDVAQRQVDHDTASFAVASLRCGLPQSQEPQRCIEVVNVRVLR